MIILPLVASTAAASFFGNHPIIANVLAQFARYAMEMTALCAKVATAIGTQKVPELTEYEMYVVAYVIGSAILAWAILSIKPSTKSREVRYSTEAHALESLRAALPDGANVVIYEDVTGSNWMVDPQLHTLNTSSMNPYQIVRMRLSRILAGIDTDQKFLYYAFGSGSGDFCKSQQTNDSLRSVPLMWFLRSSSPLPMQARTSTTTLRMKRRTPQRSARSSTSR